MLPLRKSERPGTPQFPSPSRCLTAVQRCTQGESRPLMLRRFLRLMGATGSSLGEPPIEPVTETNIAVTPPLDGPLGLKRGSKFYIF